MWSSVTSTGMENGPAPPSRCKHSATLVGSYVYLFGGRNGNLPLKDLWRYSLGESRWEELHPTGEKPPALQEHSAVVYKDCLYVFGGEVGFSAGTETPLWIYTIKSNCWRKVRGQKGCTVPRGRRGHTALVHRDQMLIYGGYQDLRGSSSELWAFHFDTESWHLLSSNESGPSPRHKHSAVLHCDAMYIYGGMTDLQERNDCWKWDVKSATWCLLKNKPGPGPLHGHAACRLPSCMLIFGGESSGLATNELWRFHFSTESWEKLTVSGLKPQPRAESVALAVSELIIQNCNGLTATGIASSSLSTTTSDNHQRIRTRSNNSSSNNKTKFSLGGNNFNRVSPSIETRSSFLKEISKLSQINLSRLSHPNKCSYSVLSGQEDNEESPLDQLDNNTNINNSYYPFQQVDSELIESSTGLNNGMVKSKSSNTITKRKQKTLTSTNEQINNKYNNFYDNNNTNNIYMNNKMTREPISVPNFRALTLPTPVLTPIEAARLVFLDPDDNDDDDDDSDNNDNYKKNDITTRLINVAEEDDEDYNNKKHINQIDKSDFEVFHQACQPIRGESYTSHLCYEAIQSPKTPSNNYSNKLPTSTSVVRFADLEQGEEATSDYASIGARSPGDQLADDDWYDKKTKFKSRPSTIREGQFGFCNPNYLAMQNNNNNANSKDQTSTSNDYKYAKMLNSPPDSLLEDAPGRSASQTFSELVELKEIKPRAPPKSLPLGSPSRRALSASRAERQRAKLVANEALTPAPLYVFLVGGKEKGQVTVFARPVSLWKLQLAPNIF